MTTFWIVWQIVWLSVALLGLCFLWRNSKVYKYRIHILGLVSKCAQLDIDGGWDYHWRYEYFESVKYDDMVNKFWRPLDSFYPDKTFIMEPQYKKE